MATETRLYHAPESDCQQSVDCLTRLHATHGVRFVRFSKNKIPFDPRHRTWGLSLDALLRTHADPNLHVGWIPASVGLTVVDVDSGDWLPLVQEHPPAYHTASRTPGRRHLVYRDTEARADINGWTAEGCSGDIRSAGPIILYDAARLCVALDIDLHGVTFPTEVFTRPPGARTEGNPNPPFNPHGEGDMATVTDALPLSAAESSQSCSLFDVLRHWAYAHVADYGDAEDWERVVTAKAEVLVGTVPDPENYSGARVRTTAKSVAVWTWERRDGFTGGRRDSLTQAWNARRRAESVWAANAGRDAEIVRLSLGGYSQRIIARSMGVSPMTVNRVLSRLEEAEDGAPELRMDAIEPEPIREEVDDARTEREPFSDGPGPRLEAVDRAGWPAWVAGEVPRMPGDDSAARASTEAAPHGVLSVQELRSPRGGGVCYDGIRDSQSPAGQLAGRQRLGPSQRVDGCWTG